MGFTPGLGVPLAVGLPDSVQPHLGRGLGTRGEAEQDKASREGWTETRASRPRRDPRPEDQPGVLGTQGKDGLQGLRLSQKGPGQALLGQLPPRSGVSGRIPGALASPPRTASALSPCSAGDGRRLASAQRKVARASGPRSIPVQRRVWRHWAPQNPWCSRTGRRELGAGEQGWTLQPVPRGASPHGDTSRPSPNLSAAGVWALALAGLGGGEQEP